MVLAAGESKRFEAGNKLLFRVGGKSLIRRVVETALASLASEVIVVTGYQAELVEAEISDLRDERLRVVRNPEYREGMSSSVRVGVASASPDSEAVAILPADVAFISPRAIDEVILAYARRRPKIAVASHAGRSGHPILFDRSLIPEILGIDESTMGLKAVVRRHRREILRVPVGEEVLVDVDRLEDLERAGRLAQGDRHS